MPLIRALFRVASPFTPPFLRATAYQIGVRSPSTATPHVKLRCRRKSVATLPVRADGAGEGTAAPTPDATTPCRDFAKAWIAESYRTRSARPMARGGLNGCPPPTGGTYPLAGSLEWEGVVDDEI